MSMSRVKLSSLEQYKALVAKAKNTGYTLSNCYFLAPEIQKKIDADSLYGLPLSQGLLLLEDCGSFYRCYYYLGDSTPEPVKLDKDAVIEFPFNAALNEKQQRQIELIGQLGFRLGRESALMRVASDKIKRELPADERCQLAIQSDAEEIMRLLYGEFNPLYAFLPTEAELAREIEEKHVFVVRDQSQPVGVLVSSFSKKTATTNLLAINPNYRGNGLGGQLLDFYHKYYRADAAAFQHWVDLENEPAIRMYQKFGYEFTSRKANEYIYMI